MDYRESFRNLRIDHDLEQTEVAKVCHVSNKTVSHWETLRREMPVDCIKKRCEFYNASRDNTLDICLKK